MPTIPLRVSEEIPGSTDSFEEYIPTPGKEILIRLFHGSAAFTQNSYVAVIWKFMHATETEEIIWSLKGEGKMPFKHTIPASEVDGIRKLAVVCSNGETGNLIMSGYSELWEDD